ncbi:MFS transporter [Williamsia herbipolensis]|uniref:MFS transporter n=1 Tax=Williamsia herbipolensis TaxID=1603258 RepID=A0AAU4K756_9NOCA|nr:MFS transporter [Williamsia herbipolensis]
MLSGVAFIAATYGLVRLAYGLFLPDVQADIGMSSGVAGLVSSGSSLFYCVAAVAGLVLGGRGARGQVAVAAVSGVVGVWGMAAADGVAWFAVSAIVGSAGAGLASPALVTIVGRSVAPDRVSRAQSVVNAGTGPGVVGAGVLALVVLPEWRTAWWVVGAATAVIAVALLAADRGTGSAPTTVSTRMDSAWLRAHAAPAVAAVLMGAGSSAMWTYGRGVLVDAGVVGERGSVGAWVLLGVGATTVIATSGAMSRLAPRSAWTVTCGVLVVSVAALGVGREQIVTALVACACFGWGFTAATSALIAWSARIDRAGAAQGTALLFVSLVLGQAVGSAALGGMVGTLGYAAAFVLAAGLCAAAVVPAVLRQRAVPRDDVRSDSPRGAVRCDGARKRRTPPRRHRTRTGAFGFG